MNPDSVRAPANRLTYAAVKLARRLGGVTPAARQAAFLVAADGLANVFDYGFHIYLGRSLAPQAFATVQTLNAVLLIILTAAGVWQPVVARLVAAAGGQRNDTVAAILQYFLLLALAAGALLTVLISLGRAPVAAGLNVPATTVVAAGAILLVAFARPVVAGVLQGQQRFVEFGLARTAFSIGRLVLALLFVGALGGGALAALVTFPLAGMASLLVGLIFLRDIVTKKAPSLPGTARRLGWHISAGALLAYLSYMALINLDLVWVNRLFAADVAASYASAVLLRRALALLPGVIVVLVYPRVARLAARGDSLDALLSKAMLAIGVPSLTASALYFMLPRPIIAVTFGAQYVTAAPLLGWLGLAMTGYAFAALWMNVYLATRPTAFTALLAGTALAQVALYNWLSGTVTQILSVFLATGWFLAIAGLLLYVAWLRPALAKSTDQKNTVL